MPGKKPGTRSSKPRKAAPPKAVARRPEPRKSVAAARKPAAAAAAAKPPVKATRKGEIEPRHEHRADRPAAPAATAAPARPAERAANSAASALSARVFARNEARGRAETEESEGPEAGSLLAGPRNVKPYTPKRGEQYMSKEQLTHFQQILMNWKRDLMEEVDRTVSHMKDEAANFPDPNDRATQEEEFSLELRTRDRERKLIRKIEEALKRIEDGSYGYCLETGEEIGIKRLEARPVATLSIEAQERRERRERQYGDRDDRYR